MGDITSHQQTTHMSMRQSIRRIKHNSV